MPNPVLRRSIRHGFVVGLLASVAHLAWEYTHGGVASHHLLANPDMPAVSNWWGLLLLPYLGWLASHNAIRRAGSDDAAAARSLAGFMVALLVGLALSLSFKAGLESVSSGIFLAALASGLLLRTYRAECILGFVLAMTFVLGSILPTIATMVGAGISAVAFFVVRPTIGRLAVAARA